MEEINYKNKVKFLKDLLGDLNGVFARNRHDQNQFFKNLIIDLYTRLEGFEFNDPTPPNVPKTEERKVA